MWRKIAALAALLILLMVTACAEIITVSFPCYDLTRAIVGDSMTVSMLIKPGQEVHAYDPSPSEAARTVDAEAIVCIGGESDVWLDTLLASADAVPPVIRLIDSVVPLKELDPEEDAWDEHIWTSPKNELLMLDNLEAQLCVLFPAYADEFRTNAAVYRTEIEQLDSDMEALFARAEHPKVIFADRFPFLYLAHTYGLDFDAAFLSCTADTEPSARRMCELIDEIREENIQVIYTIEMSTGNVARTLSEETGAEILSTHSVQTVTADEFAAGETYVTLMYKNLEAMEKGINENAR